MKRASVKEREYLIGPLTTSQWIQSAPYNNFVKPYLVGCTALAIAQLMRANSYPAKGKGMINGIMAEDPKINIDGYVYRWDLMDDKALSEEARDAISTMIGHVACAINTRFGLSSSSQLDFLEEISALVDNFSYEDDISYISYKETNNFTDYIQQSTINDAVIENLQMGFPVLVDIPGHSTVCDGYMGDGVFSFNYGWGGGSSYYYNLTNDMQGCKPVCIIFGIRPSSEPLLVAEKLLVTNNVLTQLSSSSVEVVIKNITDTSFEGHLNLVSCDKNNFKRNVISKNVNISLASGEESSLIIPIEMPIDISFGERYVEVMYLSKDGMMQKLKDSSNNILKEKVTINRHVCETLHLVNDVVIPTTIPYGSQIEVEIKIHSEIDEEKEFFLLLTDINTNIIKTLGSTIVRLDNGENSPFVIKGDFNEISVEQNYRVIIATKSEEVFPVFEKLDLFESDVYILSEENYSEFFSLSKNIPLPDVLYSGATYPPSEVVIQPIVFEGNKLYDFYIEYLDVNGRIIRSNKKSYGVTELGEIKIDLNINPGQLNVDQSHPVAEYSIRLTHSDFDDNENRYIIKPEDISVSNPALVNIFYRNPYDFMFLTKSIEVSKNEFNHLEQFDVTFSSQYMIEYSHLPSVEIVTFNVKLKDEDFNEYLIGSEKGLIYLNESFSNTISSKVSEHIPSGKYTLYVQIVCDHYNDPLPEKVYGYTNEVLDGISITII